MTDEEALSHDPVRRWEGDTIKSWTALVLALTLVSKEDTVAKDLICRLSLGALIGTIGTAPNEI